MVNISKSQLIIYIIIFLIIIFLGNYLFARKFIQPNIVRDAVKEIQANIEENYNQRLDNLNTQIRGLDGKINSVEKKRQDVAKDVASLKQQRQEYKPPASLQEAVRLLKERGYEVTIKN